MKQRYRLAKLFLLISTSTRDLLNMGAKYAELGGILDLTTSSDPNHLEDGEVRAAEALKILLDKGIDIF